VATATGLPGRENAAVSGGYTAAKVAAEESDFTEAEPFRVAHPAAGAPGEESKEESKEVAEESPEDSATEPSGEENPATEPAPRRWRRRLNPEELLQQQLLEEELQDQELLALEAEPATAANAAEQRLNLELPLLPNEGRLEQWRRSVYRATSPEN
jgi:hypothetical protein